MGFMDRRDPGLGCDDSSGAAYSVHRAWLCGRVVGVKAMIQDLRPVGGPSLARSHTRTACLGDRTVRRIDLNRLRL